MSSKKLKYTIDENGRFVPSQHVKKEAAIEKSRKENPVSVKEFSRSVKEWHIAAINLEFTGVTMRSIGKIVGKSGTTISRYLRSKESEVLRREIHSTSNIDEIKSDLRSIWPLAIRAVRELLEGTDPDLVVQRANKGLEVLEALGAKEAEKIEVTEKVIVEAAREAVIAGAKRAQALEEKEQLSGNA